jgi:hypothetical protein
LCWSDLLLMPQQQISNESSTDGPPNACHGRLGRDAVYPPVRNNARASAVSNLHGCAVPACWDMPKLTPVGTSEWPKLGCRQAACGRSRSKRVLRQATEFARTRWADRPAFPPRVAASSSLVLHSSGGVAALLHFCPLGVSSWVYIRACGAFSAVFPPVMYRLVQLLYVCLCVQSHTRLCRVLLCWMWL